jgi:chromosomal replication initiation ATPase DnaA
MITMTQDQAGEVLSLTISDGRRTRTYSAGQLLDALARADRLARRITQDPIEPAPYVALDTLLVNVAEQFHVPIAVITGASRAQGATQARFALVKVARRSGHTLTAIGALLGGRDHTTIMHAETRADELARTDPWYAERLAALL